MKGTKRRRQTFTTQPLILAQGKYDQLSRLFTILSDQVKEYQYSTTMPEEYHDGNPKFQTMLLVYDELFVAPYTVRGSQEQDYQKNDENKRESKFYFLVPDDFDWLKFAETLKNAAEDIIKSENNADTGWAVASTVKHIFRLIFGPKSFRSEGTNNKRRLGHRLKMNKRREKSTRQEIQHLCKIYNLD